MSPNFESRNIPAHDKDALFMHVALFEAEGFVGATAPNPPVGACLVKDGRILGQGAHMRAGGPHAEIVAMKRAASAHGSGALNGATLYVTLEPCNHHGKTPPCADAILEAGVSRIVIGARDPNPNVAGNGAEKLRAAGRRVELDATGEDCRRLIAPFAKWSATGLPWVTHKLAYRVTPEGRLTMIPESGGDTTFTSDRSLREAHLERRKSDAILTGLGTVLADHPKFNVRHVPDHQNRRRYLIVMSENGTEPPREWLEQEWDLGFEVLVVSDLRSTLKHLGALGVHRVLVEAGPTLSAAIKAEHLWDERVVFIQRRPRPEDMLSGEALDYSYREFAADTARKKN